MAPARAGLVSRRDGTTQFEMRTPRDTTQVRERPGRRRVVTAFDPRDRMREGPLRASRRPHIMKRPIDLYFVVNTVGARPIWFDRDSR
jgi:hypothetical protein